MAVIEAARARRARRVPRVGRWALVLVAVLSLVVAALAGRALLHRGEVMPGVQVLGADLGGLDARAATARIEEVTAARLAQPVSLDVGPRDVSLVPAKVLRADAEATAAAALAAGRDGWKSRLRSLLSPITRPAQIRPRLEPADGARRHIGAVLAPFSTPPVSAAVTMEGLEPTVSSSSAGRRADRKAVLREIERRTLAGGDQAVPVRFGPTAPAVGDDAARRAADEARLVVSAPVALTVKGTGAGSLTPEQLADLLVFRPHDGQLVVLLNQKALADELTPKVQPFSRDPVDASFEVDGTWARVLPAVYGQGLDPKRSLVSVLTAAHKEGAQRTAELELKAVRADLTTADAKALGIRRRISTFTTDMGVSSSNRIHNVQLMADYIDGTIIQPGDTFSFNERVGPRTPERGFLEGQMIVGSLLLPSIGGGVCQTATTLFNNAFELGLPILERHNHSFYISHYPLGRDATVSWGGPDFKFRNDLKHAILIKSSYTSATLTFTFYGSPQGRRVISSTSDKTNWQEPQKTYALDPAAPPGSVRLVAGSHEEGFDVTVYRTVIQNGKTIRKDSFPSHYIPVGDTEIYGPGATIPGPYFVIPTT
jgi:vancomycin resistance protein YoaR